MTNADIERAADDVWRRVKANQPKTPAEVRLCDDVRLMVRTHVERVRAAALRDDALRDQLGLL